MTTVSLEQSGQSFARFALLILLYLEEAGLVPRRFDPAHQAAWRGMMPHSRKVDLFELAVRDGVRANLYLFVAFENTVTRNKLRALNEQVWHQELQHLQSLDITNMPVRQLYSSRSRDLRNPPSFH